MVRPTLQNDTRRLIESIELSIGRKIKTPRDFSFLRECIFARLRVYLSESTLKRVWGYLPVINTRSSTLNILASFVGYASFEDFINHADPDGSNEIPSSYMLGRHLSVDEDLETGSRVLLIWQPARECVIELIGPRRFKVIRSVNTRLKPDDTFSLAFIIEGEPLYLDNLIQGDSLPTNYSCGRIPGVRFQVL